MPGSDNLASLEANAFKEYDAPRPLVFSIKRTTGRTLELFFFYNLEDDTLHCESQRIFLTTVLILEFVGVRGP